MERLCPVTCTQYHMFTACQSAMLHDERNKREKKEKYLNIFFIIFRVQMWSSLFSGWTDCCWWQRIHSFEFPDCCSSLINITGGLWFPSKMTHISIFWPGDPIVRTVLIVSAFQNSYDHYKNIHLSIFWSATSMDTQTFGYVKVTKTTWLRWEKDLGHGYKTPMCRVGRR